MRRNFFDWVSQKRRQFGTRFSTADLAEQFVPHFESGDRIEVLFSYGDIVRGTVGVTTGWRPAFILLLRRNSMGSSHVLKKEDKVLRIVRLNKEG